MTEQRQLSFQPKRERKRDKLLALLLSGRRMSKIDILSECRILNAGDNILKLRRDGHPEIQTKMMTNEKTGENYAVYFVARVGKEGDDGPGVTVGAKGTPAGLNLER